MKSIVLAEKPSVAAEYAKVLDCRKKSKGFFEGRDYIVTWALGHLVTLAEPGDYDNKYKEWRIEDLPMLPEKMRLKVIRNSSFQFKVIRTLVHRKDVGNFIIATDAGREGELVARWIMILSGWKGPFKRLWISSQTFQAIKLGFAGLKDGKAYNNLFNAALSRAEADWLIGLNVTRALTCKFDAQLSAGRVQTPTLSLIIAREEEIKNFKPVDYWTLEADFGGYTGQWRNNQGSTRIFDFSLAKDISEKIKDQAGIIIKVIKETKVKAPPLAFDLTELQREANKRYGYSAKKTLSILQNLYEHHKLVTYPRTDSRYITEDMVKTLKDRLRAVTDSSFSRFIKPLLDSNINPGKWFVNNSKVGDHHAIIPTEEQLVLTKLDSEEKKIYNLILKRFITVLYPFFRYEQVTVVTVAGGEKFYSKAREELDKGFKIISPEDEEKLEEKILPNNVISQLKKGEKRTVVGCKIIQSKTSPPARYTEATLLTAMEFPARFIEDTVLRESLKDSGLGTPATRAEIIEKLINVNYIERNGRELVPTKKGYQLIDLVPEELKSPALTAKWESRLAKIASGKERKEKFIEDIKVSAIQLIKGIKADTRTYKAFNLTKTKCPVCSALMLLVNAKKGKMLKCSDRKCGYTQEKDELSMVGGHKRSKQERALNKRLINRYSDNRKSSGASSLGHLLEAALDKKKK
jgi:DNA topoisomerase-3